MGLEPVDKLLLFSQHRLLPAKRGLLIRLAYGSFTFIEIVIAGIADDFAGVDLRNLRDNAVHEFAIMRSHQQRPWIRLQKLLQPDDGFNIQMVRRFIHQQNFGLAEQHPRQRDTHLPSARKRAHIAINLVFLKAQSVQHFARLSFEGIAAEVFVLFLHFAEAVQNTVHIASLRRVFHRVLQGFEFMMQVARASTAGNGFIEHGAAGHLFHILAEIADGQFLRNRYFAFIGIFLAHHHAEERSLARAVGTHQPHLLSRVQLKGGFDENELLAVLLANVGKRNHGIIPGYQTPWPPHSPLFPADLIAMQ